MKRMTLLMCLLALAGVAGAAEVTVGRIPYRDVTIVDVTKDTITFLFFKNKVSKPLADITRVTVDGNDAFNEAEKALADGDGAKAADLYQKARKDAQQPWLLELISHRLAQAKAMGKPASPAGPATAGGETPPAGSDKEPTAPPVDPDDPLVSPKTFADLLQSAPKLEPISPDDAKDTSRAAEARRRIAERKHQGAVAVWRGKMMRYRGKKVTWTATFRTAQSLTPPPPTRRPTTPVRKTPTRTPSTGAPRRVKAGEPRPPAVRPRPRPTTKYPSAPQSPGARSPSYTPRPRPKPRPATPARPGTSMPPQRQPEYWRAGSVVTLSGEDNVPIIANVLPLQVKALEGLAPNQKVQVTGRIRRDLEPLAPSREIYLDLATVTPVDPPATRPADKPAAIPIPAARPAPTPAPKRAPAKPDPLKEAKDSRDRLKNIRDRLPIFPHKNK